MTRAIALFPLIAYSGHIPIQVNMIIDSHVHIAATEYKSPLKREELLKRLLKEAKANNISRILVIAGFRQKDAWDTSTGETLALTKNIPLISVIGSLDVVRYTKRHLVQLEGWIKSKKVVGIKIYTGYQHIYPSDKRCLPLYKLCLKYNIPVVFHSGDTLAGYVDNPKVKYSHPLHIDEVATDFPNLKIVIAHMGNPWLIDCAEVMYKNPNVHADISGLVVGQDLTTPYGKLMKRRIEELMMYVGANKLLYGTDWPLCTMNAYLTFTNTLRISKADRDKILYKNAKNIFNL